MSVCVGKEEESRRLGLGVIRRPHIHAHIYTDVSINKARMEWLIGDIVLRFPVTPSVTNSRVTSLRSLVVTTSRVRMGNSMFLHKRYKGN